MEIIFYMIVVFGTFFPYFIFPIPPNPGKAYKSKMDASFFAIPIIVCAFICIRKGVQTQVVLIALGLLLILIADFLSASSGVSLPGIGLKFIGETIPAYFLNVFSGSTIRLALVVMTIGGYAKYMSYIGSADAIMNMLYRMLPPSANPYLAMSFAYLIGQFLNLFIPSAAGLALLLITAVYETLLRIGTSRAGAAAVVGTTGCLDLGPFSVTTIVGAIAVQMPVMRYFLSIQLPVALITAATIAALHYTTQKFVVPREKKINKTELRSLNGKLSRPPNAYALFPALPFLLIILFSAVPIKNSDLNIISAVCLSFSVCFICDLFFRCSPKHMVSGLKALLSGVWQMTSRIVTLILSANFFVLSLQHAGVFKSIAGLAQEVAYGPLLMLFILVLLTATVAILSGSGSAAFISLSGIATNIAPAMGMMTVAFILPMQMAAGMFRSLSPVSGVIIAVAGTTGINPVNLVKQNALPITGGFIVMLASSLLSFGFSWH